MVEAVLAKDLPEAATILQNEFIQAAVVQAGILDDVTSLSKYKRLETCVGLVYSIGLVAIPVIAATTVVITRSSSSSEEKSSLCD
eukprot:9873774-Ditylum_brightwellii.AAC.1